MPGSAVIGINGLQGQAKAAFFEACRRGQNKSNLLRPHKLRQLRQITSPRSAR
jgi:hypothetical protein